MSKSQPLQPVEIFHAGPPKTATTWVFHCLKQHPQISTSQRDAIHYFDMFETNGQDWYDAQFTSRDPSAEGIKRFDPTYSYICSPRAPQRIAAYNPNAKVMVCLRNPVERAFSHYWHLKKQINDDSIQFEDIFKHYNTFATWLEHGFVGIGLQKFYDALPRENIQILKFEDLSAAPEKSYEQIADFCGIDKNFRPDALNKKINVAGAKQNLIHQNLNRVAKRVIGESRLETASQSSSFARMLTGKSEYVQGMPDEARQKLLQICEPEIKEIERLTGLNLEHWRKFDKTPRKESA